MEEIQLSQSDLYEPPLRRSYLMTTGTLLLCFMVGFLILNTVFLLSFRQERLEDLHGDIRDQSVHLRFALYDVANAVDTLDSIFYRKTELPFEKLLSLFNPIPLSSTNKYYARLPVQTPQKNAGLIYAEIQDQSLDPRDIFLISCLVANAPHKMALFIEAFPSINSLAYISSNVLFFYPWTHFPPRVDPAWVQEAHNLQFTLLKTNPHLGWRHLSFQGNSEEWTISYITPHFLERKLAGFFALTLKSPYFKEALDRLDIPFGRFILLDKENQKIFHKDKNGFNFQASFLNEDLPAGINLKEIFEAPPEKLVYHPITWFRGIWTSVFTFKTMPFKVLFICDSWELFRQQIMRMSFRMFGELIILACLLIINYRMIHHFFTRPLSQFMAHINQERLGLKTNLEKFSSTWKTWALLITSVFQEKRRRATDLEVSLQERSIELRDTIERLQKSQKQIIAQEKLAGLGTLATGIAHELKNPLHFVMNFALLCQELVQELSQKKADADVSMALLQQNNQKIIKHAEQANAILNRILFHTRRQNETLEAVDLRVLTREYTSICYQGLLSENTTVPFIIELTCGPDPLPILCYPHDLGRVFLNILSNGLDAIIERFKNTPDFIPRLWVSVFREKENAVLSFKDNGPGIPLEFQGQIFDPFFSTKKQEAGSGLGLSISYDITQRHGGTIELQTKENETIFLITIPLVFPKEPSSNSKETL